MEKRSRRRIRDLVARPASLGLSENEIGCARISMMARNTNVPFKGRIQKRKTYHLQIITFRLQRAAGPYSCANYGLMHCSKMVFHLSPPGLGGLLGPHIGRGIISAAERPSFLCTDPLFLSQTNGHNIGGG